MVEQNTCFSSLHSRLSVTASCKMIKEKQNMSLQKFCDSNAVLNYSLLAVYGRQDFGCMQEPRGAACCSDADWHGNHLISSFTTEMLEMLEMLSRQWFSPPCARSSRDSQPCAGRGGTGVESRLGLKGLNEESPGCLDTGISSNEELRRRRISFCRAFLSLIEVEGKLCKTHCGTTAFIVGVSAAVCDAPQPIACPCDSFWADDTIKECLYFAITLNSSTYVRRVWSWQCGLR